MNSGIDYQSIKSQSVVESVKNWITQQIINGTFKPGDKLPTENELYQNLGASRNSIREAIKQLEAYGVVYIKRAEGTYISDNFNQKMLSPLLYSLLLCGNNWEDFVEFRRAIDIGCLYRITSKNLSHNQLNSLYLALENLDQTIRNNPNDKDLITKADCEFHNALIALAENPQLETLNYFVNQITTPSRLDTTEKAIQAGKIEMFAALHRQIYDVIVNKNKQDIEEVIAHHYIYWEEK